MRAQVRSRLALLCLLVFLFPMLAAHAQGSSAQTIHFLPISDRPVTTAPFQVVAVSSSELPVALTVQGPATLDDRRLLTLTGVGMVTVSAAQPGNAQYAATSAQLSFQSTQAPASIAWQPGTITYGTRLSASMLNATATAVPLVSPSADAAQISLQLNTSAIAPGVSVGNIPYPQTSPLFRYEGSTMVASTAPNDQGGYIPNGSKEPLSLNYRVAFTCDCQQFEFVMQSRGETYRLWVDGSFQGLDAVQPPNDYDQVYFVRVQFPDKRARQIKVELGAQPPFFGVVTANGDTISAPQVPVGKRVIIFGDSWTAPTIVQAALPPAQDGVGGSGYGEFLGQYFNWDYWVSGSGGEGFTVGGPYDNQLPFPQRVLTDVCPFSPAAVLLFGGTNDGAQTQPTVQAAVNQTFTSLQSCLPGVPIYFYGPQFSNQAVEAAFAAAVPAYQQVRYVDMGAQNWLYGDPSSATAGNEYLYFNAHPTPLGHNFLAEKFAMDLVAAYPSMLPAPYPLFAPAPVAGAFQYSAAVGALLPAGSNQVTADFTPTDPVNYAPASAMGTVTVLKANTSVALALRVVNGIPTLTATVKPQIAGTPTGSVAVSLGGLVLATVPLRAGVATFTAGTFASGGYSLSFTYSGDSNFNGSSASVGITVAQPVPANFSMAAAPTSVTVQPVGGQASVSLVVTPSGGLTATLSLNCLGMPANTTCSFADGSTLAVAGSPANTAVIFTTPAGVADASLGARQRSRGGTSSGGVAISGVLGLGLLTAAGKKRRRQTQAGAVLGALLVGLGMFGLGGCGATRTTGPGAALVPGSYTIQIQLTNTATTSMTHAATVTLVVQ